MILKICLFLLIFFVLQLVAMFSRLNSEEGPSKLENFLISIIILTLIYTLFIFLLVKKPTKIFILTKVLIIHFPTLTLAVKEVFYESYARFDAEEELGFKENDTILKKIDFKYYGEHLIDIITQKV